MNKTLKVIVFAVLATFGSAAMATEQRLQTLQKDLLDEAESAMNFWLRHGPDREFGGFHGRLARDGQPLQPDQKGLVQQSRHLWALSAWHPYAGEKADQVEAEAHRTFYFLRDHFLEEDGEFITMVERNGDAMDTRKNIYPQSYTIYGLSQYALSFDSDEARLMALRSFESLDSRGHDAEFLGYDESDEPGWLTDGAHKGVNTHMHLLEALTPLYELTGDARVKARLEELVEVVLYKIIQPEGYAHLEFYRDWRPYGEPRVSYGHNLEIAWLLLEAYEVLERKPDQEALEVITAFASNSAHWGYDAEEGGYFNSGEPGSEPDRKDKSWWVQTEAITGLWWLYRLTGEVGYLDKLEATFAYSQAQLIDHEYGGWYSSRLENGELGSNGTIKGHLWKTSYHTVRGLVFTHAWMLEALADD
ncbi:MAG: AGE family epimerase/isomerase [Porticoccaceae bacterium]